MQCEHLENAVGMEQSGWGELPVFRCRHHKHSTAAPHLCVACPDFLAAKARPPVSRPPFPPDCSPAPAGPPPGPSPPPPPPQLDNWPDKPPPASPHPSGVVVNRYGQGAGVADLYRGASCFLVLGGPSLKTLPLHLLARRGVLIMSVNNCPAGLPPGIRPHIWLHTDPCRKFHDSIWRDPSILKFTPVREWGLGRGGTKAIRHRGPDGKLSAVAGACAKNMPAVLGFHRNTAFFPENWLYESSINRGNDAAHARGEKGHEQNGWPNVINTMFAAFRLAFYLGIKTLYLLGCDFRMTDGSPYVFAQKKSAGGVRANNDAFAKMCAMFDALRPRLEAAGFYAVNCNPDSGLWTFPFCPFEDAIAAATEGFTEELETNDWYND